MKTTGLHCLRDTLQGDEVLSSAMPHIYYLIRSKDNYLHGVGGEASRETLVLRQWAASQDNLGFIN